MTDGLVIVDKPAGWTSHDVVGRMRRLAKTRRIGHAGTLDPMATGVLVLGVNKATRFLNHLVLTDKEYCATIRLGATTVTDDAAGEFLTVTSAAKVTEEQVLTGVAELTGDIMQVPSSVSAIKVAGQRSYTRVRNGDSVSLPPRPVRVIAFTVLGFDRPTAELFDVHVVVSCSSGTYIRALARDLGAALGVGGHLTSLRRTRVGKFTLQEAKTLDELAQLPDPVTMPLLAAVSQTMPMRLVSAEQARALTFGKRLTAVGVSGTYAAVDASGVVLALLKETDSVAAPTLVFVAAG